MRNAFMSDPDARERLIRLFFAGALRQVAERGVARPGGARGAASASLLSRILTPDPARPSLHHIFPLPDGLCPQHVEHGDPEPEVLRDLLGSRMAVWLVAADRVCEQPSPGLRRRQRGSLFQKLHLGGIEGHFGRGATGSWRQATSRASWRTRSRPPIWNVTRCARWKSCRLRASRSISWRSSKNALGFLANHWNLFNHLNLAMKKKVLNFCRALALLPESGTPESQFILAVQGPSSNL